MISVEEAFETIVGNATALGTKRMPVTDVSGFVLAAPVRARRTQPGCNVSAMDGYAVKSSDLTGSEVAFKVIGESAAGTPFGGTLNSGEAVRIFTGAAVPEGADQIILQENTGPSEGGIFTDEAPESGRHIRLAGYDFSEGQTLLEGGTFLTAKSVGLLASGGHSHVMVHRSPRIAILSTGDELVDPDAENFEPHQTVNSNMSQLIALVKDCGADAINLGQAGDDLKSLKAALKGSKDADVLLTVGGASVGDKDLIQQALAGEGMELGFWKVAMKPGKPLIFGKRENQYVLGLPGNPVSAFVCALVFLRPLIDKLMGRPAPLPSGVHLPVAVDLPANGPRQDYMRARLIGNPGERQLDPAVAQDSGQISVLAYSDGLIIRPPHANPVKAGESVPFLPF